MGSTPATTFSADEEDAIDLACILSQSLFEANDVLQRARTMYGPVVGRTSRSPHRRLPCSTAAHPPARQLLDVLTEACDGKARR